MPNHHCHQSFYRIELFSSFPPSFRLLLLALFAPLAHAGASGCDIYCYDAGVIASHLNGSSGSACNSCQFAAHDACCQSECSSTAAVSSGWYSSNYVYLGSPYTCALNGSTVCPAGSAFNNLNSTAAGCVALSAAASTAFPLWEILVITFGGFIARAGSCTVLLRVKRSR